MVDLEYLRFIWYLENNPSTQRYKLLIVHESSDYDGSKALKCMYYNSKCKDDKRNSVKTYKRYGMEAKDFQQFIVYKMHKRCYNRYTFDNHA